MIELAPYQDSKILMASCGDATLIVLPFTGGYKAVLMFFMSRRNDGKYWSPSVMIPLRAHALRRVSHEWTLARKLCKELIEVAKGDRAETICWGQVKKGPLKLGEKVYVRKRHMFLRILGGKNVSIRIGETSWISPKKKSSRDLLYSIQLSPKNAIKLADSITQLLKDFKPIKLPRPFSYLVKEKLEQQLLKTRREKSREKRCARYSTSN